MSDQTKYIKQVFETALYFRDLLEEENGGRTDAINVIKPDWFKKHKIPAAKLRKFVQDDLFRKRELSLREASIELAMNPVEITRPHYIDNGMITEINELSSGHERNLLEVKDKQQQIQRSFQRAARYLHRVHQKEVGAHSRVVEIFVPNEFVPTGNGSEGGGHREHVIPCAFLRDVALELYDSGAGVDDVASFLRAHVYIVNITKFQQETLDKSKANAGRGLKKIMPENWRFGDDPFMRLTEAEIDYHFDVLEQTKLAEAQSFWSKDKIINNQNLEKWFSYQAY